MKNVITRLKQGHISAVVLQLLEANNTVTTLEVKNELRRQYPEFAWVQKEISEYMNDMHLAGDLTYEDNGTYRVYSGETKKTTSRKTDPKTKKPLKAVKAKSISKTVALDLMAATKGHFFTAEFKKKDGEMRVMNCQYIKDQDLKLGYVKVKEAALMRTDPKNAIRQINIQTLKSLKIGGVSYKVK